MAEKKTTTKKAAAPAKADNKEGCCSRKGS